MQLTETHNPTWRVVLLAALIVALVGLAAAVADAADDRLARLDRKVRVMEKVIDEVLVQSPNVTVGPGGVTRGVVLDEFGALFTLEASVGVGYLFAVPEVPDVPGFTDEDELIRVMPRPMRGPRRGDDEEGEKSESWEEWQKEAVAKRKEQYAAFKTELIDTVIDYGTTLTELTDDQWVAVMAFLDGSRLLGGDSERRVMVKVKMRDLRQYSAGSLSREAAAKRVTVMER